jgi:hypothetical protein
MKKLLLRALISNEGYKEIKISLAIFEDDYHVRATAG